ncbi:MAG: hypothetical protein E6I74_07870 [Chloroflexi bacterium]|nr:MAG: hypothetical protein E6I74_07870 [Chloroflexota bacterium]
MHELVLEVMPRKQLLQTVFQGGPRPAARWQAGRSNRAARRIRLRFPAEPAKPGTRLNGLAALPAKDGCALFG